MEFRILVIVPDLPFSDEASWEPFIATLEHDFQDLGPALGWHSRSNA